jgi:nucleoside-diphosphate-sugar epimerase
MPAPARIRASCARNPLRMDNARLEFVLGREPHTPLDEAVAATLSGLGCLLQDLGESLQR